MSAGNGDRPTLPPPRSTGRITHKQFGDAMEHYVISSLGLAGIPASKMPDNWPGYDVLAQPHHGPPQRINVKARRFPVSHPTFSADFDSEWEWLALVGHFTELRKVRCWLLPRAVAKLLARKRVSGPHRISLAQLDEQGAKWEDNFSLRRP